MKHVGVCRFCGFEGDLSFEHVPPKRAFNGARVDAIENPEELFGKTTAEVTALFAQTKMVRQQAGAGAHTLCSPCNSALGAYSYPYAILCEELDHLSYLPPCWIPYEVEVDIRPLNVFKAMMAMMVSVAPNAFSGDGHIRNFLKDKDCLVLDKSKWRLSLAVYSRTSRLKKTSGLVGITTIDEFLAGQPLRQYSEVAFHPLAVVMSHGDYPFDEDRFADLSSFLDYRFNERARVRLRLSVLTAPHLPCAFGPIVPKWFHELAPPITRTAHSVLIAPK